MSERGSTTTKPVPAPRRGRKPKEPRALDKLQNVRLLFQDTFRQFYEWMDKLVCCPTRKGETLPKWADLLKNELFVVLEEGESFSNKSSLLSAEQRLETALGNCTAMLSQIREELNTPTDNEQLLRLKRMSKSPHSKPRLGDLAL